MAETKTPRDKTLSVGSKTLSLKPRAETGIVRQSFSHGRTKQVVVEKKPKRRMPGDAPVVSRPSRLRRLRAARQPRQRPAPAAADKAGARRAAPACCCER